MGDRDCDKCICCTMTGNCTSRAHTIIKNKKRVITGIERCPVYDGEKEFCVEFRNSYYDKESYNKPKKE